MNLFNGLLGHPNEEVHESLVLLSFFESLELWLFQVLPDLEHLFDVRSFRRGLRGLPIRSPGQHVFLKLAHWLKGQWVQVMAAVAHQEVLTERGICCGI